MHSKLHKKDVEKEFLKNIPPCWLPVDDSPLLFDDSWRERQSKDLRQPDLAHWFRVNKFGTSASVIFTSSPFMLLFALVCTPNFWPSISLSFWKMQLLSWFNILINHLRWKDHHEEGCVYLAGSFQFLSKIFRTKIKYIQLQRIIYFLQRSKTRGDYHNNVLQPSSLSNTKQKAIIPGEFLLSDYSPVSRRISQTEQSNTFKISKKSLRNFLSEEKGLEVALS